MLNNQISPFEYVSILVSIILGLGITQLLGSFSDLLYNHKKITFYGPHSIWVLFILFLHIQDWFITYQLKDLKVWYLPQLVFVLLYPITLFTTAKMLLPSNDKEEQYNMVTFYNSQFPVIFILVSVNIFLSILFNIFLLQQTWTAQFMLITFLIIMSLFAIFKPVNKSFHFILAIIIAIASVISIIVEKNSWVIK